MPSLTKKQKIGALVKLVQRRCRGTGLTLPPQRSVLQTLMYAALLENATFDKANHAYTVLENYYIDWNEIRVCSVRELADTLLELPEPEAAADRIRKALQGIFEKTYTFDLEDMRKKGKALAEHIKALESMSAGTPYMIQYVAQVALDGHLIPFDEASLRIMRRLGLSQVSSDGTQEICVGLDRVILKKSSVLFATQLHHFAASYYDVPESPELLSQLSAIDREAVNRSWCSPILTASDSAKPTPVPIDFPSCEVQTKPVKPEAVKLEAQSRKQPESVETPKPASKPMKKASPVKPVSATKKSLPKKSLPTTPTKAPSGKQAAPKQATKPTPTQKKAPVKKVSVTKAPMKKAQVERVPKKKVPVKKTEKKTTAQQTPPVKPPKKVKTVSPSKALRRKKPK